MKLIEKKANRIISLALQSRYVQAKLYALKVYDIYTYLHCLNVAVESVSVGIQLHLSKSQLLDLAYASLLHDIGKMQISKKILNKRGRLTKEEFEIMKKHPLYGANDIKESHIFSDDVIKGILMHHENYDGSGYLGKKNEEINIYAKIIRITDTYDAMTDNRPYHKAKPENETIYEMSEQIERDFDPSLFKAFLAESNRSAFVN